MQDITTVRVAIIGCGTVGGAAAQLILSDRSLIRQRTGVDIELSRVAGRSLDNARSIGVPEQILGTDIYDAVNDPKVDVVLELIGGTDVAREVVLKAVRSGKHVVTANKALLAHHGEELFAEAAGNDVTIAFEASCGGGIPIIRAITSGLAANHIDAIYGIVNGTSNFILTEMIEKGTTYAEALAEAQRIGLAEADPTLDVAGVDSAHKVAIMSSLAFGLKVDFDRIPVEGIHTLEAIDVGYGTRLGYVVKLLAVAMRVENGVSLNVRPAFISREHPLAWVSGPFNAVSVYGHATGHTLYYGRGAGGRPTASAVLADVIGIGLGTVQALFEKRGFRQDINTDTDQVPVEKTDGRFYLRAMVEDEPGVLAQIASILGRHGISIASVLQQAPENHKDKVAIVITTHRCNEGELRNALHEVRDLPVTDGKTVAIPIVEEHPEKFVRH